MSMSKAAIAGPKKARRRTRYSVLACAGVGICAIKSGLSFAIGSAPSVTSGPSTGGLCMPTRSSIGCSPSQVHREPQVARQAEAAEAAAATAGNLILGGVIDVTKMSGETTIILQCAAAVSLVLAGNYLIAKEEAEHKEKEEKEAKEGGAKEAVEVEEEEYDIWRDSLLRYLGYSNELGEALRPVLPAAYLASYCLAFAYVFADSVDKGNRADKKKRQKLAKSAFLEMDVSCTGTLSKEEVQSAFKKMKTPLSEADIDKMFAKIDTNSNQQIELKEFMAAFDEKDEELVKLVDSLEKPAEEGGILANPSLVAGADALIWQVIASVALPGFTINRFVTLSEIGCEAQAQNNIIAEYFPTVLGLSMIPIVCKPLDELADFGLDATLRPFLFSAVNADKAGTVEYEVLAKKMKEKEGEFDEKAMRALFDNLDTEKTGRVPVEAWTKALVDKK